MISIEDLLNRTLSGSISLSVKKIAPYTLFNNSLMTELYASECLQLGERAIGLCYSLSYAYLPNCSIVGDAAFVNCSSLNSVILDFENVQHLSNVFTNTKLSELSCPNCTDGVFYSMSLLTNAYLPKLSVIRSSAFYKCDNLENLTVDFSLISNIGSAAFYSCKLLSTSLFFPNCKEIYYSAFYGCSSLETIDVPMCNFVGIRAFYGCRNLQSFEAPNCGIVSSSAFLGCINMSIGNFSNCISIGTAAFSSCSNLELLNVPYVQNIGDFAFSYCTKLQQIRLLSVKKMTAYAFYSCYKLESIYILASSVCTIYDTTFATTPITVNTYLGHYGSVYVPSSLVDSYKAATNWVAISDRITAYIEE